MGNASWITAMVQLHHCIDCTMKNKNTTTKRLLTSCFCEITIILIVLYKNELLLLFNVDFAVEINFVVVVVSIVISVVVGVTVVVIIVVVVVVLHNFGITPLLQQQMFDIHHWQPVPGTYEYLVPSTGMSSYGCVVNIQCILTALFCTLLLMLCRKQKSTIV